MRVTFAKMHFPLERERDIRAKKCQILLDPSNKLLLRKHNMHTFKILIHSMKKKVTNITLSSLSSLSWSLTASSSALWKYGKFSVWTFIVCESIVTDWWVKSMTPIQVVPRSYQTSERESWIEMKLYSSSGSVPNFIDSLPFFPIIFSLPNFI